ncbi:hypothetical protein ANCCEY_01856 [Ancylostoma ceylanicum]|uniref:Intraflagellar transport protein 43 homolog n=1 Tax=Ancylostoma ceylanicum TaxID=53326 RepID=A0A0D6M6I7_9BILA|nr:hypothetical protein ANCCEY_01856 [Ancylostoma ceylanicum]
MADYGIDSKPRARGMSARVNRRKANLEQRNDPVNDELDDTDSSELSIRVKDRTGDDILVSGKKGRMGSLFKEAPMKGLKEGAADALKRPLTGIFRRPGSRSGRKREDLDSSAVSISGQGGTFVDERSLSPELAASSRMRGDTSPSEFDAIARAPHLTASQLHGMLQIDSFASKYPHLAKLDDIDISLLSRYLYSEEEVRDEDVPWTWDYLFASVSSELREEWAQEEVDDSSMLQ